MTDETDPVRIAAPLARESNIPSWLSLPQAVRLVALLVKEDQWLRQRIIATERRYIEKPPLNLVLRAAAGKEVNYFEMAAHDVAKEILRQLLALGEVRGNGFREDLRQRGPITDVDWATRRIDCAASALLAKDDCLRRTFPPITGVVVSRDDLLTELDKWIASKRSRRDETQTDLAEKKPLVTQANSAIPPKKRPLPQADEKKLRAFLISWQSRQMSANSPYNEELAHSAAEDHFDARITRQLIRTIRRDVGLKGCVGRRKNCGAAKSNGGNTA
ncbi:MAG TPA: hypothetical protein VIF02_13380 [Methylocella sp.]|jgi:hypothetical protein